MAKIGSFTKQPGDILDYDVDYSAWLIEGDAVSASTVLIELLAGQSPGTLAVSGKNNLTSRVKLWLTGGANGDSYKVTVTMTSTEGRVKQDEFTMKVKEV